MTTPFHDPLLEVKNILPDTWFCHCIRLLNSKLQQF